jgi:hypothetical protein
MKGRFYRTSRCQYCQTEGSLRSLRHHHAETHPDLPFVFAEVKTFKCDLCPQVFASQVGVNCHKHRKHGVNVHPNLCTKCNLGYSNEHKCPKDRDAQKFPCTQCDTIYSQKNRMEEHVAKVHENNTPFQCQVCDKKWVNANLLKRHMTNAHEPVQCPLCERTICSRWELKKHLVFRHQQTQGAYFCSMCPKTVFFHQTTLARHMKDKHGILEHMI